MKKILTLICCTIVLAATSCKKEYVTTSPSATTIFDTTPAFVLDDNVNDPNSVHAYTTTLNVPEITDYYDHHGAVLVYLDEGNGFYEQLPNVYNGISYRHVYQTGKLYIDAQNADGSIPTTKDITLPIKLKIVLVP